MGHTADKQKARVVVVGAGFGGLEVAQALKKAPVEVILIDQQNYHTFQPLLYQVASAGLEPGDIAHAVRHVLHRVKNCTFRMGTVTGVDWDNNRVQIEDQDDLLFDYLVLALGATTNDFGVSGVADNAFPLKSLNDAVELRNHVLRQFEKADQDPTLIAKGVLNFVVVGGGATGVETAGALMELFQKVLKKDLPRLDINKARVILVEMADGLLTSYTEKLQQYTVRSLKRKGVEVRLQEAVVRVTDQEVELKSGEVIPAHTLIWAAGIRAHPLADLLGVEQTRGKRIVVEPNLAVPNKPNVFVIGDMAASKDEQGELHPQVASTAQQGGRHAARQIQALLEGKQTKPFVYKDLGQMATIGRNAAVVELPSGMKLKGWFAWMAWLVLHLVKLIGFRNRISVMINWIWNYFTYDRSARLILESEPEPEQVTS